MVSIVGSKGVDISYAQGDINLAKVKAAGYGWVMIRCAQGTRITDDWFATNVKKAEAAGMPWGAYLLTEATTTAQAKAEVAHADKLIKAQIKKGYKPSLPIAIDIEEAGYDSKHYTPAILTEAARVWVTEMKKLGYYPMIYTGFYELRDYISSSVVNSCDIWLAEWGSYPDYTKSNLGFWQYSDGDTDLVEKRPLIPGINIPVDKDKAYKDYPSIIKKGGYNGWKKTTTTTTPTKSNTTKPKTNGISAQHVIDTAYSLLNQDKHPDRCDIMDWYGTFSCEINEVACCCAGMMYLFNKAGALSLIPGGKVADCGSLCVNFYKAGQLYGPDKVKPGDLVIFSWSKEKSSYWPASALGYKTLDHVELCVSVDKNTIKCIGANNGGYECDDFQLKVRDKSNISCCCRPKYSSSSVTPTPAPSPSPSKPTSKGSSAIKSVQNWLNKLYNTKISVDGVYGAKTKAALVKALQTELNKQYGAGLSVDGIFGPKTKAALPILSEGVRGRITKILQGFLICNGYSTNGFDGIFGDGTESAVKEYQNKNGLDADGIVGPVTFSRLAG